MLPSCKPCHWPGLAAAVVVSLAVVGPARADFFLVTDRAALRNVGRVDAVDWGVLGPPFTVMPNPFAITSAGGVSLTVSQMMGPFARRDEGFPAGGWNGNFAVGDHLLWTRGAPEFGSSGPITLDFGDFALLAGGAQIQSDFPGAFVAQLEALDAAGNVLGVVTRAGVSNDNEDNSAIWSCPIRLAVPYRPHYGAFLRFTAG
jgi:hypothetical protein